MANFATTMEVRLQCRSFPDEEGKVRMVCQIVADDVQFVLPQFVSAIRP